MAPKAGLCLLCLFLTVVCQGDSGAENDDGVIKDWMDLVIERDALELAAKHQLHAELEMLEKVLLPGKGIQRERVEQFYGRHLRVIEPNLKQPDTLFEYAVGNEVTLRVHYEDGKCRHAELSFSKAKWSPVSARIGTPTYRMLLEDMELKVKTLGEFMFRKGRPSNMLPWLH